MGVDYTQSCSGVQMTRAGAASIFMPTLLLVAILSVVVFVRFYDLRGDWVMVKFPAHSLYQDKELFERGAAVATAVANVSSKNGTALVFAPYKQQREDLRLMGLNLYDPEGVSLCRSPI